jgi:hypothetical protein
MQIYATMEESPGADVKIKFFVDGHWHAMLIARPVFDLLIHEIGEIIKRVLMVR